MRRILASVIVGGVALASVVSPVRAGTHPPTRNGFMIGFGLGGGSLTVENADKREGGLAVNFRIGYSVRQDLVLHFEGSDWSRSFDEAGGNVTWNFSVGTAALTWFPGNNGFFVRGGVGFATASAELERDNLHISSDENGLGLLAAAGYEWRLSRKFALGPQVEYVYEDLDSLGSSNAVNGALAFNWYW